MEIKEGNKLIAQFMGYTINEDGNFCKGGIPILKAKDLRYDHDWNWLMPVLEKISTMEIGDDKVTVKHAYPHTFGVTNAEGKIMVRLHGFQLYAEDTLIKATHVAIVHFIDWYNSFIQEKINKYVIGQEIEFNFFGHAIVRGKFISIDSAGVITFETTYDGQFGSSEIGKINKGASAHLTKPLIENQA